MVSGARVLTTKRWRKESEKRRRPLDPFQPGPGPPTTPFPLPHEKHVLEEGKISPFSTLVLVNKRHRSHLNSRVTTSGNIELERAPKP